MIMDIRQLLEAPRSSHIEGGWNNSPASFLLGRSAFFEGAPNAAFSPDNRHQLTADAGPTDRTELGVPGLGYTHHWQVVRVVCHIR